MGQSKSDQRKKAAEFFIENIDATLAEVASLYRVTAKTLGDWAKKDDWEQQRLDYHASPVRIKQLTQRELLSVAQGNAPKLPADNMSKLMAVLDKCNSKADPIVVARILKDLDNFICNINPALALQVTPYHKQFLQHRINIEIQ